MCESREAPDCRLDLLNLLESTGRSRRSMVDSSGERRNALLVPRELDGVRTHGTNKHILRRAQERLLPIALATAYFGSKPSSIFLSIVST